MSKPILSLRVYTPNWIAKQLGLSVPHTRGLIRRHFEQRGKRRSHHSHERRYYPPSVARTIVSRLKRKIT